MCERSDNIFHSRICDITLASLENCYIWNNCFTTALYTWHYCYTWIDILIKLALTRNIYLWLSYCNSLSINKTVVSPREYYSQQTGFVVCVGQGTIVKQRNSTTNLVTVTKLEQACKYFELESSKLHYTWPILLK